MPAPARPARARRRRRGDAVARFAADHVAAPADDQAAPGGASREGGAAARLGPDGQPGFESTKPGKVGAPEGWWAIQHAGPDSYVFEHDSKVKHSGERSMRVTNIGPEPFGSIYQTIPAIAYRGKTLRFSAWVRTEGTIGNRFGTGAGLKLHAVRGGYPLEVAEMRNDAVHGTVEWTRYEIALRIPDEAEAVEVGMLVFGPGIAWLDDAVLDVVPDLPPKPAAPAPGAGGPRAP